MIIGNVIQFGTFSLRPSITAATTSVIADDPNRPVIGKGRG